MEIKRFSLAYANDVQFKLINVKRDLHDSILQDSTANTTSTTTNTITNTSTTNTQIFVIIIIIIAII